MNTESIILLSALIIWLLLTILELINIHKFNLKLFNLGALIRKKEVKSKFMNWRNFDGIYQEKEGKYVFIPDIKTGYFVTRFYFVRRYGIVWSTNIFPLTIFGTFKQVNDRLIIEYKISYRLIFMICFVFLAWLYIPIYTKNLSAILVSVAGILLTSLIAYISYRFKRVKMELVADEIEHLLKLKK